MHKLIALQLQLEWLAKLIVPFFACGVLLYLHTMHAKVANFAFKLFLKLAINVLSFEHMPLIGNFRFQMHCNVSLPKIYHYLSLFTYLVAIMLE